MKKIVSFLGGFLFGAAAYRTVAMKKVKLNIEAARMRGNKLQEFYELLLLWLELRQRGGTLLNYFDKRGYKEVAIYGVKELGQALNFELERIGIEVKYLIDKNADTIYSDKKIYLPDDNLPEVDAILVTALHYYSEIENELSARINYPIINLTDIIYEALTYQIEKEA